MLPQLDRQQAHLWSKLQLYNKRLERRGILERCLSYFRNTKSLYKRGIYCFGPPGRGKTMLMDAFIESVDAETWRAHFYNFMLYFHNELHKAQDSSAIEQICIKLSKTYKLICLDEMQVNNIADAMLVERIFSILMERGIILLFTSNIKPQDLYKDGLQRQNFLPFIALIEDKLDIVHLDNGQDYRYTSEHKTGYYQPINSDNRRMIDNIITNYTRGEQLKARQLQNSFGREIRINRTYDKLLVTNFDELCGSPLWSEDYRVICENFDFLVILNIPVMNEESKDEMARFITLIDYVYELGLKLICLGEDAIENLYQGNTNKFEFNRTISRLKEIRSI